MDIKKFDLKKIGKNKLLLLGLAGILLIASSYFGNIDNGVNSEQVSLDNLEYNEKMEYKLKTMVETINGVENVSVFITTKEENGYLTSEENQIEGVALTAKGIKENKEIIVNMISNLFDVPVHKISVIEIY